MVVIYAKLSDSLHDSLDTSLWGLTWDLHNTFGSGLEEFRSSKEELALELMLEVDGPVINLIREPIEI